MFRVEKKTKFDCPDTDDYLMSLSKEELIKKIRALEQLAKSFKNNKNILPSDQPLDGVKNKKNSHRKKKFDFSKCEWRNVALHVMYLGWKCDGFVDQDHTRNTVERHIFDALVRTRLVESRQGSFYSRCGRTDNGVSSYSQVISLRVRSTNRDEKREIAYCAILNAILPDFVRVLAWAPVDSDFKARFDCQARTYKYWFPRANLDIELMDAAIQKFVGSHDFRNFCKMDVGNGVVNFTRNVHRASVKVCWQNTFMGNRGYDMCELTIVGKAFLYHQVRAIVAVLSLIGQRNEQPHIIDKLLDVRNYPRKPNYTLSNPLPLNLFDCHYERLDWIYCPTNLKKTISTLQHLWCSSAVKMSMIGAILNNCDQIWKNLNEENESEEICEQFAFLYRDFHKNKYKPLLSRPMADTLEDKIDHYVKIGRIKECKGDDDATTSTCDRANHRP